MICNGDFSAKSINIDGWLCPCTISQEQLTVVLRYLSYFRLTHLKIPSVVLSLVCTAFRAIAQGMDADPQFAS